MALSCEESVGDGTQSVAHAENFRGRGQVSSQSRDVTNQLWGSAEGTTILGGSGGMPRENFEKLHLKYAFLCILEASFSIMLLRDLLAGETKLNFCCLKLMK